MFVQKYMKFNFQNRNDKLNNLQLNLDEVNIKKQYLSAILCEVKQFHEGISSICLKLVTY